jgi:acetyl esterase/lipase/DNA-binding transcriptional regulator YhcF (GntR family)
LLISGGNPDSARSNVGYRPTIDNDQYVNDRPHSTLAPPKRKVGDVHGWLKRQIMLSRVTPGQSLVELEIASTMGCSQGTVREAMLRLQEDGLIVRNGYRGTIVTPISANEARAFLSLRAQLEAQALRYSLPHIGSEQIEMLSALVRQMEAIASAGDEFALFELDQQFHITLFQWAEMPSLVPVLTRCSLYNHRNKIALDVAPRSLLETARRHWRIVSALESGDAAEAERVLRHHIESVVGDDEAQDDLPPRMTPRLAALWQRVQSEDAALPDIMTLPLDAARQQFEAINARWNHLDAGRYRIDKFTIPAPPRAGRAAGEGIAALRVEAVKASKGKKRDAGTIVFIHGGGWVFGNVQTHRGAMARLAELSGCVVIGIDYGLAPEAPFPHGLNDCVWAWRWLRSQGINSGAPWFIAGDSAGANLALSSMIELRDAGEALPAAALLFYGVYSADHSTHSHRRCGDGSFGLSSAKMAWYRTHYLAGGRGHLDDPRVSPLHADLEGLPPLLVTGAELDPLFDDSVALAKRLAETDTPYEFRRYAGVNHGFMQMGRELPEARQAFRDAAAFLRERHSTD